MQPKIILTALLLCGWGVVCMAQVPAEAEAVTPTYWEEVYELDLYLQKRQEVLIPDRFRLLHLDLELFESILPQGETGDSKSSFIIEVPFPNGGFRTFRCHYAPVMHPDLINKYPMIRSYAGQEVGKGLGKIHFSFSPIGFHAIILEPGQEAVKIEPVALEETSYYLNFYESELNNQLPFECLAPEGDGHSLAPGIPKARAGDCQLRTYRLALATTAEFTASFSSVADPTGVASTLAALNAFVTQVNAIFTQEFSIQFQLVGNNNLIIFTDAGTDGFTNGDQGEMSDDDEAQDIIDDAIGSGNYDIGHALGSQGGGGFGGVSQHLGNVCRNGDKSNAASVMNPVNPVTWINFIIHEFGHQLGAGHTFNEGTAGNCGNSGQLQPTSAYEPGSGSTIMSYSGNCGASSVVPAGNIQYFHAFSLQQVSNYILAGDGSSCPVVTALTNNAPTINAGADFIVPVSTAFRLTAVGNDADGDNLTYCWEQMNNDLITHPPQSTATNGPVIRSFFPVANPVRYVPNLQAILTNTATPWEVLPSVSRTMDFRVTVRDNALPVGCTNEDNMVITFSDNAGPFRVTSIGPDPDCLFAEDNTTITWDVANTTAAPVSCANVDIWLSLDGGQNFTVLLANNTPNDGSAQVFIPEDAITTQGRIMVIGSGNIFLDINDNDIRIDCPLDIVVTDDPAIGTYRARERIETAGTVTVPSPSTTEFLAGTEVVLYPDFTAEFGSRFLAAIQACNHCGPPTMALVGQEEDQPNIYIHYLDEQKAEVETEGKSTLLGLAAFPNPFQQKITLEMDLPKDGSVQVRIIDLSGRLVQEMNWNNHLPAGLHRLSLATGELSAGVYYCQVITEQGMEQVRIVKM